MRRIWVCALLLMMASALNAQRKEQRFDYNFKPTPRGGLYYVITEKKDSLWHRLAYYLPQATLAMEGWYKDEKCEVPHGTVAWYHTTKILKSKGDYVNGKKEGTHLSFDDKGHMKDSGSYIGGRLKGMKLGWSAEGIQVDSMYFDGAGNGVQVSWYEEGPARAAGYWTQDTMRKGRWKYYHLNGQLKATEDYVDGKAIAVACYDETGQPLDAKACAEKEAEFGNGGKAWSSYISRNLKADVPVKTGAPDGEYTVIVQFIVNTDGTLDGIEPRTQFGFGMEEEVMRIIQKSPKWNPARQFGKAVKAYRLQPITFVVSTR